jgi:hypothetical protein
MVPAVPFFDIDWARLLTRGNRVYHIALNRDADHIIQPILVPGVALLWVGPPKHFGLEANGGMMDRNEHLNDRYFQIGTERLSGNKSWQKQCFER